MEEIITDQILSIKESDCGTEYAFRFDIKYRTRNNKKAPVKVFSLSWLKNQNPDNPKYWASMGRPRLSENTDRYVKAEILTRLGLSQTKIAA